MSYTGPGKLSIARLTSNQRAPFFRITIEDAGGASVEVSIEAAAFAHALGHAHGQSCVVEWINIDILGKKAEVKTEVVRCDWNATDEQKDAALRPFEIDGWRGDPDDIGNHHRRSGDGYSVTFRRWVEPSQNPKIEKSK